LRPHEIGLFLGLPPTKLVNRFDLLDNRISRACVSVPPDQLCQRNKLVNRSGPLGIQLSLRNTLVNRSDSLDK
jgi:hypothetical protein